MKSNKAMLIPFLCFFNLNCGSESFEEKFLIKECKAKFNQIEKQLKERIVTLKFSSNSQREIDLTLLQLIEVYEMRASCDKRRI